MSLEPAAAGDAFHSLPRDLGDRLRALLEGSSSQPRRAPAESPPPAHHPSLDTESPGFFWLRFPRWLASAFGVVDQPGGAELLRDLCWIQYCIYGLFRIQDDLIDGAEGDLLTAVQVNPLLVEAARCSARHFPADSPFWDIFGDGIASTSRTMIRLDRLQRTADRNAEEERRLYAELSACLKIAAAGVAIGARREAEWSERLSPALDRLATATQILDDLQDIRDDLVQGRLNYAAWQLSHPIAGSSRGATEAVIASNLVTSDRLWRIVLEVIAEIDGALEKLGSELCPPAFRFLRRYRRGVLELGESLQQQGARLVGAD